MADILATEDEIAAWRAHPVTRLVRQWVLDEKGRVEGSFARGELLDPDNQSATFGRVSRAWGRLEELTAVIEMMSEGK